MNPVRRPGCVGLRAAEITRGETWGAIAINWSPHATTDDHSVPYDQWLVITRGRGSISIRDETGPVQAGDAVALPANAFHRIWADDETMDGLALTFREVAGPELVRVPNSEALSRNAAERFMLLAQDSIAARGRFSVALSGGTTPRALYSLLASPEMARAIDWQNIHFFWGDERAVPPDHPESNYRMAFETLLSRVPVPERNVHRIPAEMKPELAASDYAQTLRQFFQSAGTALPRFDLILLGMGANGHTASLFPHTPVLWESAAWVSALYVEEVQALRITLTAPVINAADNILFLVQGGDKAETVRAVLRGEYRPDDLPAQMIRPTHGRVVWLFDRGGARDL